MSSNEPEFLNVPASHYWKGAGIGVATAVLLSAVMVPAIRSGLAPLPEQPSLAFAEVVFGRKLPLPVGLLFHLAYVAFWSIVYVVAMRRTFVKALLLALALWVIALVVFFPIVGWGFLGLGISPKLIVAALVPHILFAIILWAGSRLVFGQATGPEQANAR